MKIRNGFVSNSSSTSFTFIFKGSKLDDLYAMISKYGDHFKLSHIGWDDIPDTCNAESVIRSIRGAARSTSKYDFENISIVSIDKHISELKKQVKVNDEAIEEDEKADKGYSLTDLYSGWNAEINDKIEKLEALKKNGLTSICQVDFGDNHGQISGMGIGTVMDYEGRHININAEDFAVMIDQNR